MRVALEPCKQTCLATVWQMEAETVCSYGTLDTQAGEYNFIFILNYHIFGFSVVVQWTEESLNLCVFAYK